jgi:hypothetical protein
MRSILLSVTCFLFTILIGGCAGWVVPQQSRLEIPESAGFFIVHPQGLFFTPMALTLKEGVDGVVSVHAADSAASVHLFGDPVSGPGLAQLNAALLPFLFPSCDVPLPRFAPR